MSLSCTIITSAWSAFKYLDQYLFGISKLKSISDQLDVTLAFGSVSDIYDDKDHDLVRQRVQATCDDAGIKLHFYRGDKAESFYQTANILIAQTIGFTENYAQWNLDDCRLASNLLEQIKALQYNQIVYSDFICTNDVIKTYEHHVNQAPLPEGVFAKYEQTWPDVDMGQKEKYYREFKWSCFTTCKASLFARIGVFDERYKSSSDFCFINRCLHFGVKPAKVPGISGLFLNVNQGISTKPDTTGHRESYDILERYLANKHPVAVFYGKRHLWRNL